MAANAFHSLRHRDFRLFWVGQSISLIGTQMQRLAVLWQVYKLSESAVALGLVGAARFVPIVTLALAGGAVADRFDRRWVLFTATTVMAMASVGLWVATGLHVISLPLIYLAVAISAVAGAFAAPARQAIIPALVPAETLQPAVQISLLGWDVAGIIGPAVGGLVLAAAGPGTVYLIDALSYGAVLYGLIAMKLAASERSTRRISLRAIGEGIAFVFNHRLIRTTMILDFFATFFGQATVLYPIFAEEILHVGARGLGLMTSASAAGSVLTGLILASRPPLTDAGRLVMRAIVVYGFTTIVFGLSPWLWLTLLALAGSGAADTVSTVLRQTIRQRLTPDDMRGRMTGVNMIFFQGGPQLGELESGLASAALGPALSVALGGVGVIIAVFATRFAAPELSHYRETS